MGRTSQDNRARIRRLALPAMAAMALSLLVVATATGQEEEAAGPCSVTEGPTVEASQLAFTQGLPGTRIAFELLCTSGETNQPVNIHATYGAGTVFMINDVFFNSSSSRHMTKEIHIPVPIPEIEQFCLTVNGEERCVPPKS